MTVSDDSTGSACPYCKKRLDPLRAPAVSVIDGRITHFCSPDCRESFLKRSTPKKPSPPVATEPKTDEADQTGDNIALPMFPRGDEGSLYRSKLIVHQLTITLAFALIALIQVVIPPLFNGHLSRGVAGASILLYVGITIWREHRNSAIFILEALAPAVAATAVTASTFFGLSPRAGVVTAALILFIDLAGHLAELIGRHRSGVLAAIEGGSQLTLPSSWRDNSDQATRLRQVAMVFQWAHYPLALLAAVGCYFIFASSPVHALLAGATALLAVNPRHLRMSTGDAHLRVALLASSKGIGIRDAHAVGRLSESDVVLFMAKRSLLDQDLTLVDWQPAEHANENDLIDGLHAMTRDLSDRMALAVHRFTKSRKARASSPVTVERIAGQGLISATPWGRLVCGTRKLLLDNGISTALMESAAEAIESSGRRAVFTALDNRVSALFGIEETISKNVGETILALQKLGFEPQMVTSAGVESASALGERLGIETVHFEVPEEKVGDVLAHAASSAAKVILVGHGQAFEENLRSAHVAIAVASDESTQAGVDARRALPTAIPWLLRISKRAARSATVNIIAATGILLTGLGLALTWHAPVVVLAVVAMRAMGATGCTWNAPFPLLRRMGQRCLAPARWIARLITRIRSVSG